VASAKVRFINALNNNNNNHHQKQTSTQLLINKKLLLKVKKNKIRMWANAQRDGRPAEYRWRPMFNAAKFG